MDKAINEAMQDDELAKADIRDHERLRTLRDPWESTWKEIDERYPDGAGGFSTANVGAIRGERNYDATHITALERFAAAGVAITTPEERDYIKVRFLDDALMRERRVALWCEAAGRRLYGIRHAVRTGFGVAANEDWDQLGRYGTSPMLTDGRPGRGMFYRTLHLSEVWIDTDFAGQVDTVHRRVKLTARQLEQEYGLEALTPKMREALAQPSKEHTEFEVLHVIAPNTQWDADKLDWRRFPVVSRHLALDEKIYLRRRGYFTMPISVSRHTTSAGEVYGRSPAIKMAPTVNGLNAMRHTTLRQAHKAVDPALAFNNDNGVGRLTTRPGGLNPGLVDEAGNLLVQRLPGGEQGLPFAADMIEQERATVRTAFLEEFYKILTDPNSRMTTTEVLEVMAKQGVLVRPFASRYATEKQDPVSQRELDLALRFGQLDPLPPEVLEAGAWPQVEYENMLAAMARAESTAKGLRFAEVLAQLAATDGGESLDWIDRDSMIPGIGRAIGVPESWMASAEDVMAKRQARAEEKQAAMNAQMLQQASGAALDLAKAGQISEGVA